jgi:hypothetical protein
MSRILLRDILTVYRVKWGLPLPPKQFVCVVKRLKITLLLHLVGQDLVKMWQKCGIINPHLHR